MHPSDSIACRAAPLVLAATNKAAKLWRH